MATIQKDATINADAERVWAAVRDIGAVHERLARGFVVDTRLEGDTREVTFSSGVVVRERIVDVDDGARRLAYSIVGGRPTYHDASIQVFEDGDVRSRIVWITELLPDTLVPLFDGLMDQGCAAMKATLERA